MESEVLLYDECGNEIEVAPDPPVLTLTFVIPLFVCTMIAMYFAGSAGHKKPAGLEISDQASKMPWTIVPADGDIATREGFSDRPQPADHPPKIIQVDGYFFAVHYARRSELLALGCTGQTIMSAKQVWLPSDASGSEIRETLLHELMHVALHTAGGEYQHPILADQEGNGEPVINPSARILVGILRDNPKLVAWLEKP